MRVVKQPYNYDDILNITIDMVNGILALFIGTLCMKPHYKFWPFLQVRLTDGPLEPLSHHVVYVKPLQILAILTGTSDRRSTGTTTS